MDLCVLSVSVERLVIRGWSRNILLTGKIHLSILLHRVELLVLSLGHLRFTAITTKACWVPWLLHKLYHLRRHTPLVDLLVWPSNPLRTILILLNIEYRWHRCMLMRLLIWKHPSHLFLKV